MAKQNGSGRVRQEPDDNFPLILVCEDTRQDLTYTIGLLQRNGFRVTAVSSYREAVQELGRKSFAAVVADYWLADRMAETGEAVLFKARELQPSCARVLFTADPIGADAAERVGASFFDKDNTATDLVELLRQVIQPAGSI